MADWRVHRGADRVENCRSKVYEEGEDATKAIYIAMMARRVLMAAHDPKLVDAMFPASSDVEVYLQPGTGHGLPFHKGAQVGFKATFNWLAKNGL